MIFSRVVLFLLLSLFGYLVLADPAHLLGGGNFPDGTVDKTARSSFKALNAAGATMCRMNLYPAQYYDENAKKVKTTIDNAFLTAHQYGITPMVLFEYYWNFPNPVGDYSKWFAIGQEYAKRYRPGGDWPQANNIENFGISVFSAFNEPDGTSLNKQAYFTALLGLADGVHSVDPKLKVNPGGFKEANAHGDYKLAGIGPLLAPLWNNGTLDGIDLHTYFDVVYAPLEGTYKSSAQSNFDQVKLQSGITRDINFYSTEWNYKKYNGDWTPDVKAKMNEEIAAQRFLTAMWDELGVIKKSGEPATQFAFVWNLFNTNSTDLAYGICTQLDPWVPSQRGATLQMVLKLTAGLEFSELYPTTRGEYVLIGSNKKCWVWQNHPLWTNHPGTNYLVEGIPSGMTALVLNLPCNTILSISLQYFRKSILGMD